MGSLITLLTSNITPSPFSAEASTEYSVTYEAWKAFDGSAATAWANTVAEGVSGTIAYSFGAGNDEVANGYTILGFSDPSNSPNTWTFEGYNGSTWTVLDTQSGITWTAIESKDFSFSNYTGYEAYRLNITNNNGNPNIGITTLDITSEIPTSISKAVGYAVLSGPPGVGVSKAVGYAVLSTEVSVGISKALGYAILEPQTSGNRRPIVFICT